jgi:hypothetical protein
MGSDVAGPRIGILVVAYNAESTLRATLDRVLDIVVLLHGDGQYAPELLPQMVAPLERGECDAVMGSRLMERGAARRGGMPLYKLVPTSWRRAGRRFFDPGGRPGPGLPGFGAPEKDEERTHAQAKARTRRLNGKLRDCMSMSTAATFAPTRSPVRCS